MTEALLDGDKVRDKEGLHGWLAKSLGFWDWYGGNLDALYDCLTDLSEDVRLVIVHRDKLRAHLGPYGDRLFRVFSQAAQDNPRFQFVLQEEA